MESINLKDTTVEVSSCATEQRQKSISYFLKMGWKEVFSLLTANRTLLYNPVDCNNILNHILGYLFLQREYETYSLPIIYWEPQKNYCMHILSSTYMFVL